MLRIQEDNLFDVIADLVDPIPTGLDPEVEQALRDNRKVVKENDNGPRPDLPYVSFEILNDQQNGTGQHRQLEGQEQTLAVRLPKQYTVRFRAWAKIPDMEEAADPPGPRSGDLLSKLQLQFENPRVILAVSKAGFGLGMIIANGRIPDNEDESFTEGAFFDMVIFGVEELIDDQDVEFFETAGPNDIYTVN